MNTKNLSTLKIHKLTQAQYDRELAAGNIDETALYLTPEADVQSAVDELNSDMEELKNTINGHDEQINTLNSNLSEIGTVQTLTDGTNAFNFKQPILASGTDFDTVTYPNTYTFTEAETSEYVNCPLSAGTGYLRVYISGANGQLSQKVVLNNAICPVTYERHYYKTWGDWLARPVAKYGTKTISIAAGENSAVLFTKAQIASLFGHTFAGTGHYTCVITNADGSISSLHAHGTTFTSDGLYALFSTAPSAASSIKLNYVMFYMP